MAHTTKMLAAVTVPTDSAVLHTNRHQDEDGIFHFSFTGTTVTFTVLLQGRPEAGAGWVTLATKTQADTTANVGSATFKVYPQMRLSLTAIAGTTPTFTGWLTE